MRSMNRSTPASTFACLVLLACSGRDHSFHKITDPNPPIDVPASLRVDLAIQENEWGTKVSRCQMQVAFEPLPEFVDPEDAQAGELDEAPLLQVGLPEAPGDCVFTEVPAPRPSAEGTPEPESDNWQLSGAVVGPDFMELWHQSDSWTLDAVDTEHGGLRYEWADCDRAAYPFSSTLTMDVPPSEDPNGVHPFTMDNLIPVGPRVILDAPMSQDGGLPTFDASTPLYVAWHTEGDPPEQDGVPVEPATLVKIKTQDDARQEATRWLVCWPEQEWMEFSPEVLAPLFEDRLDPDTYTTNIDVHMEILGTDQPTPWGEALTVRTNASSGVGLKVGP